MLNAFHVMSPLHILFVQNNISDNRVTLFGLEKGPIYIIHDVTFSCEHMGIGFLFSFFRLYLDSVQISVLILFLPCMWTRSDSTIILTTFVWSRFT